MKINPTSFSGLFEIELSKNGDSRGWFMRTYDFRIFESHIPGFKNTWMQMNHSYSENKYTWRGLHFQRQPFQETKLVRCIKGSVIDYVLDLREESSTYMKIYSVELSSVNNKMLYIPKGFAHGFLTLEDNTEMMYLHDEYYNPNFEEGVRFNDEKINLDLPFTPNFISLKDQNHKNL